MATRKPSPGDSPGRTARRLLRAAATAALATAGREAEGWPYASLVLVAVDHDATPILLLSDLAEHSRNIAADGRVSLLVDETGGLDDPLTGPRVTVRGRITRSAEPRHRARFLARHPSAAVYVDFNDFHVHSVVVDSAHFVAGFGEIHALAPDELLGVGAPALMAAEVGILDHMNGDHADAVSLMARELLGAGEAVARLIGIDAEGCDIRAGGRVLRLDFDRPIASAEDARVVLVDLARRARAQTRAQTRATSHGDA